MKKCNNTDLAIQKLSEYRVKCKCSHVIILINRPYTICNWCGRKVYRSKKDEFEDKLRKEIKK